MNQRSGGLNRSSIFISYNHRDKAFLDEFRRHFSPVKKYIEFWDDTKIQPGKKWKQEIEEAINRSKVGVLFISADFLNSDFIVSEELPKLLRIAETGGATIVNVFLKPCLIEEFENILQYQGINRPNYPVIKMNDTEREELWVELVRKIKEIIEN